MTCPRCGSVLLEKEREGVVVDACVACRGVWLDRGELAKVIVRSQREGEDGASCGCGHGAGAEWPPTVRRRPPHPHRRKRGWIESLANLFD